MVHILSIVGAILYLLAIITNISRGPQFTGIPEWSSRVQEEWKDKCWFILEQW